MKESNAVPWHRRFGQLMPFRVREILLVSSAYDAFVLEEDGSLSDRLFLEYADLDLSSAPRLTHATSTTEALRLLDSRHFDLVITVVRVGNTDAKQLSRLVKRKVQDLPVILLLFDEADLELFPDRRVPHTIDWVFQWAGDAGLLIAAIKLVEDARNVSHDTLTAGVQVILVVEDRIAAYSHFLSMLYPELLSQAGSLIAEGLNRFHRLLRMRVRPKIVLARDYEEGARLFEKHAEHICALMSDIRIPRSGQVDKLGGIRLATAIREQNPDLPMLFQSAEENLPALCAPLKAAYVSKQAHDVRGRLRRFLTEALGFGAFVFRTESGAEVARAKDTYEMEQMLVDVAPESLLFHASHNHFSQWFMARSMFELAQRLRPRKVSSTHDVESLRHEIIECLQQAHQRHQEGVITDFSARFTGPQNRFVRIGQGSVGGKGRGIAFMSTIIARYGLLERYAGLEIRIPKTVVITTDAYDEFMSGVDLKTVLNAADDEEVTTVMARAPFPKEIADDLWAAVQELKGPLAVRSSSLLEDSRFQPFAGVYATYMLPNNHPDPAVRRTQLLDAVRGVYASVFCKEARTYVAGTPHEVDEQKMAIVVQQVVGQQHGSRYYPLMSGVAQSHNDYPVGPQRPADGVVHAALGLGHIVVGGGRSLRFCPASPTVLPQFANAQSVFSSSQREFWALDLERTQPSFDSSAEANIERHPIRQAQEDGALSLAGSVYCEGDDTIRENLSLSGPRVVTFNNILKWDALPLPKALSDLLNEFREQVGEEVEIEFALDPADWGKQLPRGQKRRTPRLFLLQLRPMASRAASQTPLLFEETSDELLIGRTDVALGHGTIEDIMDIVWVTADRCSPQSGRQIAKQLRALNTRLKKAQRPYLLVGPGRWGSSDPYLGIPVSWGDISGARVIVERPMRDRHVEPSHGTHFFRNVTAHRIGYITVRDTPDSWLHLDRYEAVAGSQEADTLIRHASLDEPIGVYLDGPRGRALVSHGGLTAAPPSSAGSQRATDTSHPQS